MDILLIAGLWLPRSVWDRVAEHIDELGHRAVAVALPGVDDASAEATLDDQIAAVLAAIDNAENPVVVGHSAACTLAWIAADRRPNAVSRVVMIGGFPASDGETYAAFFPAVDGLMAFPGWEPFDGPDNADLDQEQLDLIASIAVPVPEGVSTGVVTLTDNRRHAIPVELVCPEYTPDQAKAWMNNGDIPELQHTASVGYIDIDTGHWPMVTRPEELARILTGIADKA